MPTKIEWTEETWNPVVGCSLVSQGCKNCYAMKQAHRLALMGQKPYQGLTKIEGGRPVWTGEVRLVEHALDAPLHWKRPRKIFVNSMSDLFHEGLPEEAIDRVFAVMALAQDHVFQVLTKRPERMLDYCSRLEQREVPVSLAITRTPWWESPQSSPCAVGAIEDRIAEGPLPNVWLGVSVEDQKTADERIPLLLQTPAAVRWLSVEPLLGPVDLKPRPLHIRCLLYHPHDGPCRKHGLDWVVVGGESGPGARPMHPEWVRSLREQCSTAGVPFFFKQWGAYEQGMKEWGNNKKRAGRLLDGREWNEYPEAIGRNPGAGANDAEKLSR